MYELKIISQFAAAHWLREFQGRCERLHGHNWKVEVHVAGHEIGKDGMLIDFALLKKETQSILEALDHQCLNDLDDFKTMNPSSENIARHIFKTMEQTLNNGNIRVTKVTAWESDTACASYVEP